MSGEVPTLLKQSLAKNAFETGVQLMFFRFHIEIMLANSRLDHLDDTPVLEIGLRSETRKDQIKEVDGYTFLLLLV